MFNPEDSALKINGNGSGVGHHIWPCPEIPKRNLTIHFSLLSLRLFTLQKTKRTCVSVHGGGVGTQEA